MTAITALTAQNTIGVSGVHPVPGEFILEQVRAVATDIGVDAVKIGMLGDAGTIEAVVRSLDLVGEDVPVVLDPVMVAESGAVLLDPEARHALIDLALPRATVATPNVGEARELSGLGPQAPQEDLARAVHALGPGAVVVTGGHTEEVIDVLYDGSGEPRKLAGRRYPDGASHGSGCTHSSVLAARLALGDGVVDAAMAAREITAEAVRNGLAEIGAGAGPVDVFGISGGSGAP
jgi:hydroxymethylpyrimidine/phosphomethylpyrimidine kinase